MFSSNNSPKYDDKVKTDIPKTSMNDRYLEAIIEYSMPPDQARALKVAYLYLELANKFIPNYKYGKMPPGDPRKSELFRFCYKLTREIDGKIKDDEYKLYIKAQFDILRNIFSKNGAHAMINPSCLLGEKAWNRWLIWKRKYDKISKYLQEHKEIPSLFYLTSELTKLKHFFYIEFERHDKVDIVKILNNKCLFNWISLGRVPVYYILLSPIVKSWLQVNSLDLRSYNIDLKFYESYITPELSKFFTKEFSYEF